ncbi:DNA polymerase IV [Erysipelotrichaceae bacterium RD49]|nr:DNA polymerase IV [Erysipelotrichaceae bacterium RD49]
MARVLFHIDLNAFFASAEELRHPEYKKMPLAIGSNSARGVLSTANYIARQHGIHSAMPTMQAKKLCPELVILDGDHEYYRKLSNQFFAYLKNYSGKLEVLSIDECFLDVTEVITQFPRPLDLAVKIQRGVLDELGLRCSIGVAPTRFLAKMASDMHKPMGITVLRKRDIPTKLYPLPVESCIGIGKKTVPKLIEKGIETIGDLANEENRADVVSILQNSWPEIQARITGMSSDQLVYSTTRKSVSHSRTFPHDLYTLDEVLDQAALLTRQIADAMVKGRKKGASISVVLRDGDFHNQVRSAKLPGMTNDYFILLEKVRALIFRNFEPVGYRHIGISVGSLQDEDQIVLQPTLFEANMTASDSVISSLNKQIEGGAGLIKLSDLLDQKKRPKESGRTDTQQTGPSAALDPAIDQKDAHD